MAGFIGTLWRESRIVVQRARIWVMAVAKAMWKVVRNRAIECVRYDGSIRRWVISSIDDTIFGRGLTEV